jgi:NAD(P)-dependent dehydrogenase (short-subunit alcohol dehydrogenase family)
LEIGRIQIRPLQGKVAIVTGASSGVGRATALLFAHSGCSVVLVARREPRLRALGEEIHASGGQAAWLAGDASQESVARAAVALALNRFSRIDVLINNAGVGLYKKISETTESDFEELMATNVRSGFLFSREVVPGMLERGEGTILFVSSVAGMQGAANESVYSASKFAQVGLAQSLDAELRPGGIKVGVICPGGVKTEFAIGRGRTQEFVDSSRMMDPGDVAEAILFFCTQPPNVRIPHVVVRHMG